MRLVLLINGMRSTGQSYGLEEAAQRVAQAHQAGDSWDARVALDPLAVKHRPLREDEASRLIEAATKSFGNL